jgi:N-acetylneuraminic acid mutarotase
LPRFSAIAAQIDGELYLFGGFVDENLETTQKVHSYDARSDRWQAHRDLPFEGLTHANGVVDGEQVWIVGGFVGAGARAATADVHMYDSRDDRWEKGPALPQAVGGGALARVGRRLHYVGGYLTAYQNGAEDAQWILDLDGGTEWVPGAPVPVARGHAGVAVVDEKIYIIGGTTTHEPARDCDLLHRYDPRTDTWEQLASLPSPRSHFEPGTFVHDGRVFIIGGQDYMSGHLSEPQMPDVSVYDPESDSWWHQPGLPVALRAPVARILGDNLVVTTGSRFFAQQPTADVWITSCTDEASSICSPEQTRFDTAHLRGIVRSGLKNVVRHAPIRLQNWLWLEELARQ